MLRTCDFLEQGIQWQLCNGHTIRFWTHTWRDNFCLADLLHTSSPTLFDPYLKVSEFILPNRIWDEPKLHKILSAQVIPHILVVPIALIAVLDTFYWG